METAEEKKVVYGSYLENRIVSVKPVESSGKWVGLLSKGQEMRKDPFMFNKVKRSFQVPLNSERFGGGVKVILDDQKRKMIKKYENEFPNGMTQREFFEKELGVDLNPMAEASSNWWRTNKNSRVFLTRETLKLNLNYSLDMLKYIILLSNESKICPNYDDRSLKATYEFMMVDENKVITKRVEEAGIKSQAYIKYAEVISTRSSIEGFLRSLGRTIPKAVTDDWLKGEVLNEVDKNPARFLNTVTHPQYKERIFVQEAVEAGAILRKGEKRYAFDTRELGDLTDTINYLMDPENQEVKLRIAANIEMSKKGR